MKIRARRKTFRRTETRSYLFMSNFKYKLYKYMSGRNGADNLFYFEFVVFLIVSFVGVFFRSDAARWFFSLAQSAIVIHSLFRALSKNISKRSAENAKYLEIKKKVTLFFRRQKNRVKYRKTKVYRKCRSCGAFLCLPKKKGTHTVKCPVCGNRFNVKI